MIFANSILDFCKDNKCLMLFIMSKSTGISYIMNITNSTCSNILTGMLKPTSGQVVVRSGGRGSTRVGVCPQRDVLYEHMTAREHVHLYATLNDAPSSEVDR